MKAFSFRKLNSYQLKLHFFMAKEVRKKNFNYMQFSVVAMTVLVTTFYYTTYLVFPLMLLGKASNITNTAAQFL